jgi:hypothetical protein
MNAIKQNTVEPVASLPAESLTRPEFLRLPKPGQLCPFCGMSRSAINELILPTPRNEFKPPVKSFCLRQKGAKTGIRLVDYESLRSHIRSNAEPVAA